MTLENIKMAFEDIENKPNSLPSDEAINGFLLNERELS